MPDPLDAVSPLDGRYAATTEPLRLFVSEAALMRARVRVEAEYLVTLADADGVDLTLSTDDRERLRTLYHEFDTEDADLIKRYETEGAADRPATNHDVKAVEYFVVDRAAEAMGIANWVHFGLTSEDINNLAYRLLLKPAVLELLLPEAAGVRDALVGMAREHRDLPMLARTHGQPATPTTFGKEMAVYAARLDRGTGRVRSALASLSGKLGGATGGLAAHHVALPEVDWRSVAASFVRSLGFEYLPLTTQVNPCDDLAELFDALRAVNDVLLDLARDAWAYVSRGYLRQRATAGEIGSSTMPHKVNPIDFENAEGNLSKANADLSFLGDHLTKSRLQRDLSGSTVKRNLGTALAHCLIGYEKTRTGLSKVAPHEPTIREDVRTHPEVLGEAYQTVLRREGRTDAYERVKELLRGESVTVEDLRELVSDVDVEKSVRRELLDLTPADYTGLSSALVDELDREHREG